MIRWAEKEIGVRAAFQTMLLGTSPTLSLQLFLKISLYVPSCRGLLDSWKQQVGLSPPGLHPAQCLVWERGRGRVVELLLWGSTCIWSPSICIWSLQAWDWSIPQDSHSPMAWCVGQLCLCYLSRSLGTSPSVGAVAPSSVSLRVRDIQHFPSPRQPSTTYCQQKKILFDVFEKKQNWEVWKCLKIWHHHFQNEILGSGNAPKFHSDILKRKVWLFPSPPGSGISFGFKDEFSEKNKSWAKKLKTPQTNLIQICPGEESLALKKLV